MFSDCILKVVSGPIGARSYGLILLSVIIGCRETLTLTHIKADQKKEKKNSKNGKKFPFEIWRQK